MVPLKILSLFKPAHYKFSTSESGRITSLYFEAGGIQGRWRRKHRDGKLLAYQGKSIRWFVDEQKWFSEFQSDRGDASLYWVQMKAGVNPRGFSMTPIQGYHVLELVPPAAGSVKVIVNHCSSGTVILNDPTKNDLPYDFQNYEEYHNQAMNENSALWFDWTAQWGQLR